MKFTREELVAELGRLGALEELRGYVLACFDGGMSEPSLECFVGMCVETYEANSDDDLISGCVKPGGY